MHSARYLALVLLALGACSDEAAAPYDTAVSAERAPLATDSSLSPALNGELADVRRATARYHNLEKALDDGYVFEPHCVTGEDVGAPPEAGDMGFHLVRLDLLDAAFDPEKPEALVYEERGNGRLALVGVEYLVVGSAPDDFGGEVPFHAVPELGGFALHAWVWLDNPSGMFADLNPRVTCPEA